jgi:hypothetical protein
MPSRIVKTSEVDDQKMWDAIYKSDQKDYIMTAGCDKDMDGLVAQHAYTLYTAIEVQDPKT